MSKFYFNDLQVEVGDTIRRVKNNGNPIEIDIWEIKDDKDLKKLSKEGILEERDSIKVPADVNFYITELGKRIGRSFEVTNSILKSLGYYGGHSIEIAEILWREISYKIDSYYEDSIYNYDELYVINKRTLKPSKVTNNPHLLSTDRFILFRTEEEAEFAINVVKDYYEQFL